MKTQVDWEMAMQHLSDGADWIYQNRYDLPKMNAEDRLRFKEDILGAMLDLAVILRGT